MQEGGQHVPLDRLADVQHLLLADEHAREQLLQLFVGIVDAQLLKTVNVEKFKTENVKHADPRLALSTEGIAVAAAAKHPVCLCRYQLKQTRVHAQSVTKTHRRKRLVN